MAGHSTDGSPDSAKPTRRRSSVKHEQASPSSRLLSFSRSAPPAEREEDRAARLARERVAAEEAALEAVRVADREAVALAAHEVERDAAVTRAKDLGILETPLEAARITLRMYTHRQSVFRAHSFLVGNESGGLSEQLGRIPIQTTRTTLEMLRSLIETTVDNNMVELVPPFFSLLFLEARARDFAWRALTLRHTLAKTDAAQPHLPRVFGDRPQLTQSLQVFR